MIPDKKPHFLPAFFSFLRDMPFSFQVAFFKGGKKSFFGEKSTFQL
jgi:hypothetical protein